MLYFGVGSISYWQRAYAFVDQNTRMDIDEHRFAIATKETEKSANVTKFMANMASSNIYYFTLLKVRLSFCTFQ